MIDVRAAGPGDLPFIRAAIPRLFTHRTTWRTAQEMIDGTIAVLERAISAQRSDECIVIASDEEKPLGFAYATTAVDFFTGEPHAHLSEIVSIQEGAGVGRALLAAVERWAFERGSRYVSLNVLARNNGAIAFYEKLGYEIETLAMVKVGSLI